MAQLRLVRSMASFVKRVVVNIPLVCLVLVYACAVQVAPELPPSAKQRLATLLEAKDIRDVDFLIYRRESAFDYLGIQAGFEVAWWWESVFRHGYVLRKNHSDTDWSKAELFDVRLSVLTVLSGFPVLENELLPWKRPNQPLEPTK